MPGEVPFSTAKCEGEPITGYQTPENEHWGGQRQADNHRGAFRPERKFQGGSVRSRAGQNYRGTKADSKTGDSVAERIRLKEDQNN